MDDERILGPERDRFIGRIAVLSEYVDRLEKQVLFLGMAPIPMPKLAEVRPAILAEGVVLELQRLKAELRICEQDLAEAEREREELRARRPSAIDAESDFEPTDADPAFMPEEDDPAVRHQERLFEDDPEPVAKPVEEVGDLTVEAAAPSPPQAPSLGEMALQVLLGRGSSASSGFVAGALRAMNVQADSASVEAAMVAMASAGRAKRVDICGIVQWTATR